MELIQYYIDLNKTLIELYITHPSVLALSYLICDWCIMACILIVAKNEMVLEAIEAIRTYIIKTLRE